MIINWDNKDRYFDHFIGTLEEVKSCNPTDLFSSGSEKQEEEEEEEKKIEIIPMLLQTTCVALHQCANRGGCKGLYLIPEWIKTLPDKSTVRMKSVAACMPNKYKTLIFCIVCFLFEVTMHDYYSNIMHPDHDNEQPASSEKHGSLSQEHAEETWRLIYLISSSVNEAVPLFQTKNTHLTKIHTMKTWSSFRWNTDAGKPEEVMIPKELVNILDNALEAICKILKSTEDASNIIYNQGKIIYDSKNIYLQSTTHC